MSSTPPLSSRQFWPLSLPRSGGMPLRPILGQASNSVARTPAPSLLLGAFAPLALLRELGYSSVCSPAVTGLMTGVLKRLGSRFRCVLAVAVGQ